MSGINLIVSHSCRLTSEFIAVSLRAADGIEAIRIVNDLDRIVSLSQELTPHVAVIAGAVGPRELLVAAQVREVSRRTGIVLVATEPTRAVVDAALARGDMALVSHNAGMSNLVHAIRGAAIGCPTIDASLMPAPARETCPLNDREKDLLILTSNGSPIKEIATQLFLTPGTVRNISSSAIRKVCARNRFEAARMATARGWL